MTAAASFAAVVGVGGVAAATGGHPAKHDAKLAGANFRFDDRTSSSLEETSSSVHVTDTTEAEHARPEHPRPEAGDDHADDRGDHTSTSVADETSTSIAQTPTTVEDREDHDRDDGDDQADHEAEDGDHRGPGRGDRDPEDDHGDGHHGDEHEHGDNFGPGSGSGSD